MTDPCEDYDCGHGTCSVDWTSGSAQAVCTCDTGYAGGNCDQCDTGYIEYPQNSGTCLADPCASESCNGHGTCQAVDNGSGGVVAACECQPGYAGARCDSCDTNNGYVEDPQNPGTCIDDPCNPNPCVDSYECQDATTLIHHTDTCSALGAGQYQCADETVLCASEFTSGNGICYHDQCVEGSSPKSGELVLNEIYFSSTPTWFELANSTDATLYLDGVTVKVNDGTPVAFPSDAMVPPRSLIVVADSTPTNFTAALISPYLTLTQDSTIVVSGPDGIVDQVHYDTSWPHMSGRSIVLTPAAFTQAATPVADLNDGAVYWCVSQDSTATSSPGLVNSPCMVDWCNLQYPPSATALVGQASDPFYGQVYEPGYTEGNQVGNPYITARLGYGDSTDVDNWHFTDAAYNTNFDPSSNNEEFMATITPSATGIYYYGYEMSIDGGLSWKVCTDGAPGVLTVTASSLKTPYFSEYIEGSSNNKALEIFNPNDNTSIEMSACSVLIYSNGSTSSPSTIALNSTQLAPHGTYVLCHGSIAWPNSCDQLSGSLSFNGDDAVVLECGGEVVDSIGKVGEDPGSAWSNNGVSTKDMTLRRKCSVTTGDKDTSDGFDPSVEWDGYSKNTHDGLGNYSECGY